MPRLGLAIILVLCPLALEASLRAGEIHVAFWNIENLFDLQDDPAVELDEEFTPQSPKRWTAERLERKLANLASVLRKVNGGRGADILGLSEVENRKVVEMLVEKLALPDREYKIVHQDSPSDRGIDCALVYDAKLFTVGDARFHFVDADRTRDIVEARLRHEGAELFVFVNHWPSRNNDEWQRITAATVLRTRLDAILAADPSADILLVGDFNDEPDNVALQDHLRASVNTDHLPAGALYNTSAPIQNAAKGTVVWDNRWQVLDQIIISAGLLDETRFRWRPGSTRRLEYPELFFHPNFPDAIPRPSRSYSRDRFHKTGYSDHLPVTCVISN